MEYLDEPVPEFEPWPGPFQLVDWVGYAETYYGAHHQMGGHFFIYYEGKQMHLNAAPPNPGDWIELRNISNSTFMCRGIARRWEPIGSSRYSDSPCARVYFVLDTPE
jgi:hypothetical protein